jgi:hypothetical protein
MRNKPVIDMETTQHEHLRHAVARVAKLAERLLLGAAKHYCQIETWCRSLASLLHRKYFKSLVCQLVEFRVQIPIGATFEHYAVFPQLRLARILRGLSGRARECLRKRNKITAVDNCANSESSREDHGGRDEPFKHDFSLIFERGLIQERVSLSTDSLGVEFQE